MLRGFAIRTVSHCTSTQIDPFSVDEDDDDDEEDVAVEAL